VGNLSEEMNLISKQFYLIKRKTKGLVEYSILLVS